MVYCILVGIVVRVKRIFSFDLELVGRSLWLMYHPERGVLPCDGWQALDVPILSKSEIAELRARYAADCEAVERRMRVKTCSCSSSAVDMLQQKRRIAIHLHVYFVDVLSRIVSALKDLSFYFDLYVSVSENVSWTEEIESILRRNLPFVDVMKIVRSPNRGRDLAPMICSFGRELAQYDFVAHFHTKQSRHLLQEEDWLEFLLRHLLSPTGCGYILSRLENGVGMVIPPDFLAIPNDPTGWMHNLENAERVVKIAGLKLNLKQDYTPCIFPQGSMFWARGDFMKRFLELPLSFEDFECEPIGLDGALAHALERLLCVLGSTTGMPRVRLADKEKHDSSRNRN